MAGTFLIFSSAFLFLRKQASNLRNNQKSPPAFIHVHGSEQRGGGENHPPLFPPFPKGGGESPPPLLKGGGEGGVNTNFFFAWCFDI